MYAATTVSFNSRKKRDKNDYHNIFLNSTRSIVNLSNENKNVIFNKYM